VYMAAILDVLNLTDLNFMKKERKKEGIDSCDCITDITEKDKLDADYLDTLEREIDEPEVELFGEEEIYCCGEVGYWKDSRWDSQMRNSWELGRDRGTVGMKDDEEAKRHKFEEIEGEGKPPGVPEEYDRGGDYQWANEGIQHEEAERAEL